MHRSKNNWSSDTIQHDSGSESAPLLSSGSHTSAEPVIFQDSETSDLDFNPTDNCSTYGSTENGSFHSTATVIPKRLPPLTQDNALVTATSALNNEKYEGNNKQPLINTYANSFLHQSYSLRSDILRTGHKDTKPKQSSLVTVFSVWNTILGSSLLTMPWGIQMAGFFPGIILILVMSGLCLYTAYCLLAVHKYHGGHKGIEVTDLSRIFLSKWAEYIAKVFSIMVLLGATIAYWVLMSNFLYNSVNFIYDNIAGLPQNLVTDNSSQSTEMVCLWKPTCNGTNVIIHERTFDILGPVWDLHKTVPIFLGLLIFPILNFNSATFFTKFNSLGTVSIAYLIIFVMVKSASWGINMSKTDWEISWTLKPTFAALSGMLALSFFIHNIIVTIMQNNYNQSKNGRDLSIAYLLVTLTYISVGIVFYVCFPLSKSCIEDNFLNNFPKWDGLTLGARIVLLFQLLTVYPLLAYMLRMQLLSTVCKTVNKCRVVVVNIVLVSICILFATFVPYIGMIIRYTGALSGFIYVFTLPSLLYLKVLKQQDKLTLPYLLLHISIPILGASNLLAQFFINDS